MNNTTNTETSKTKTILKDLLQESDSEKVREMLEFRLCDEVGELLTELSAQQIDGLVNQVRNQVVFGPATHIIAKATSEAVAEKVLFNPTSSRWIADKAVNILTTAVGVGALIWTANRLGITLVGGSSESVTPSITPSVQNDPFATPSGGFSDTTSAPAPTRRRGNVVPFDTQAS
jgi:hypothetical protein